MRRHADGRPILLDLLAKVLYVDLAGGSEDCVFIAGAGRSGTTWVMELVNANRDHRVVFEPFASHRVRALRGFPREPYIRPDDRDPEVVAHIDRIVSGRYRSWWTDQHNRTFVCRKRLIKAIRANLCLGFIRRRYPRMPIILLVRHPCAAVRSMVRLGYGSYPMDVFSDQAELVEDHLAPYLDLLRSTEDSFDQRVLRWCIQHKVMFSQLTEGDVHLMFYEELCTDPSRSFAQMCSYLGRPYDHNMRKAVHRPSRLSADHSEILGGSASPDAWREGVSAQQAERAMGFLETFGLGDLYSSEGMPNRAAAESRLTANAAQRSPGAG
jgi:hypothetical protein